MATGRRVRKTRPSKLIHGVRPFASARAQTRKRFPAQVTDLIGRLKRPLSSQEARDGWTDQSKAAIASYFERRLAEYGQGTLVEDEGLVRGLDAWGVGDGDLYYLALRLNRGLS